VASAAFCSRCVHAVRVAQTGSGRSPQRLAGRYWALPRIRNPTWQFNGLQTEGWHSRAQSGAGGGRLHHAGSSHMAFIAVYDQLTQVLVSAKELGGRSDSAKTMPCISSWPQFEGRVESDWNTKSPITARDSGMRKSKTWCSASSVSSLTKTQPNRDSVLVPLSSNPGGDPTTAFPRHGLNGSACDLSILLCHVWPGIRWPILNWIVPGWSISPARAQGVVSREMALGLHTVLRQPASARRCEPDFPGIWVRRP